MKEPSPSRDEILRRVAQLERRLERKDEELRELRKNLAGIAEALRAEEAPAPPSEALEWEAVVEPIAAPAQVALPFPFPIPFPSPTPPSPEIPPSPPPPEPPRVPSSISSPLASRRQDDKAPPSSETEPAMDLETRIGAVWFNRIGIVAIVIGFGLFARYFHERLLPWHKVACGYAGSFGLFLTGWLLEKRLRLFARPVMAGGLAIAFFTSFGAHFVKPMECIPLALSILLMSISILGVFACAERWKSEATAGFAIFLGHVAAYVAGGDADTFSLVAILFLSAAGVLLFLRHDWAPLSLFAVVAGYGSHFLWAIQEHPASTQQVRFWANFSFFTSYFAIFLAADLVYRHRAWKTPGRYTRAQKASARALGPVSLILYVTFSAGIFHVTEIYWSVIHLWLFPLAALEAAMVAYHRRRSSADAPFHAAAATVLATLGLFSLAGGLTLNLALAAEASMLLLLARRQRLWFLQPLAQGVLGVSFVHYWLSDARSIANWPAFLGSATTALVYFAKSRLDETWPAIPPDDALLESRFAAAIRRLFERLSRPLACLHAALGGVLLSYACSAFFSMPWDAAVLGAFAAVAALAALFLESGPLLFALGSLEAGCVLIFLAHSAMEQVLETSAITAAARPATVWLTDQIVVAAIAALSLRALAKAQRWNGWAGLTAALGAMAILAPAVWIACSVGQPLPWLVPLWAAAPGVFWIATEAWARRGRWVFAVIGAILIERAAFAVFPGITGAAWFLSSIAPAILCAALWRDGPRFLPGIISLLAITAYCVAVALLQEIIPPDSAALWAATAAPLLVASMLMAAAPLRRRGSLALASLLALAVGSALIIVLAVNHDVKFSPLSLWLLSAAAFWLVSEPLSKVFGQEPAAFQDWRDRIGVNTLMELAKLLGMAISLAGSLFLLLVTVRHFTSDRPEAIAGAESIYTLVFLLAAYFLRSPGLAGAYAFSLSAAYAVFFTLVVMPEGSRAALEHPRLGLFLTAVALLAGGATERVYLRRKNSWSGEQKSWAAAGAWYPYVLSLLLGSWLFGEWGPSLLGGGSATGSPARAAFALACFLVAWRMGLAWLQLAAHGTALVVALALAQQTLESMGHLANVPLAAVAVAFILVVMERVTARRERRSEAAKAGPSSPQVSGPPLRHLRLASVAFAAGLLLITLQLSKELEGSWTTFGWSLVAFALAGLGFLWKDRIYRRTGLAVFALSLLRAVLVDVQQLELFYRMLAFLCLGACLLGVSFLYTKFREEIKKWL